MQLASRSKINSFLLQLKYAIDDNKVILLSNRPKNQATLLKLLYTPENALEELLSLTYKNYCSGPEKDIGKFPGQIWKFGKSIQSIEVYIKIRLVSTAKLIKGVCISFHEWKYKSLTYPYK